MLFHNSCQRHDLYLSAAGVLLATLAYAVEKKTRASVVVDATNRNPDRGRRRARRFRLFWHQSLRKRNADEEMHSFGESLK